MEPGVGVVTGGVVYTETWWLKAVGMGAGNDGIRYTGGFKSAERIASECVVVEARVVQVLISSCSGSPTFTRIRRQWTFRVEVISIVLFQMSRQTSSNGRRIVVFLRPRE
ncbi:unnamed protein product [Tuber melanosporum]|uniref:(Perigord truffle) hypothetical protein n=1 Tax=Tuber melanosporum (strain Mel28) TaxID=656061 RepID=D5GFT1_TUBMM|nr:uncharacterized protein GSTUM_00007062001 [Tuber melanosporum]CAZ83374.1 unnamed protein product [Tuber melanosporum]